MNSLIKIVISIEYEQSNQHSGAICITYIYVKCGQVRSKIYECQLNLAKLLKIHLTVVLL